VSDTLNLTAKQQRQIERLSLAIDHISDDDRNFFVTHPERNFRIRLMSKAERRQYAIINGPTKCPPGCRRYILIKQIVPGMRIRIGAVVRELNHAERFSDAACRRIFEEATAGYQVAVMENALRTIDASSHDGVQS